MLIDSHCHLKRDSLPDILSRAAENEVSFMITVGAGEGYEGNEEAVSLSEQYPQIFSTVGIHPHDAKIVTPAIFENVAKLAMHEKVVAIGEVGLDFHYEHSPRKVQEEVLKQFIGLAHKTGKPLMIHDRDAGERTYEILKNAYQNFPPLKKGGEGGFGGPGIMIHCFTGTKDLAKKYLDLGCMISFTGIVTFKKSEELRDVVRLVPIERMLIETDSPYLAPEPFRGKTNEPAYVKHVAEKIAELKGLTFDDVARITTLNAKRFFKLPLPELVVSVAYAIRDSLYLNITNRCTLACTFCPKFIDFEVKGYYLKLPKEPTVDEVLKEVERHLGVGAGFKPAPTSCKEIVFCGYGEPTRRLPDLIEIASRLKHQHPQISLRLNTDGLGNLVHGKNILPELAPYIDALSVSLNAADAKTYAKYCPSKFKEAAYPAVKDFIREATHHIRDVTATVVGLPEVDKETCRKIAEEELGAKFRYREYNNVG